MKTLIAFLIATLIMATPCFADLIGDPHIHVTAVHLGGGFIQYTVDFNNPLGGSTAVSMTAEGNFNQIDANVPVIAGGTGMLDPVNTFTLAIAADVHDANYLAAGGSVFDSWYDMTVENTPDPPFGGVAGGEVGSMTFSLSAGSPAGNNDLLVPLAQFVIFDAAVVGLPLGPQPVVESGFAPFSFIDSLVAADGMNFDVNGSFAVIPEPSTFTLAGFGLIGLLAYGWRRRRA